MDGMEVVRLGIGYRINGVECDILPVGADALSDCQAIYEEMPGWSESTLGVQKYENLPERPEIIWNASRKFAVSRWTWFQLDLTETRLSC